jgi:site-specific DNA recombinase
MAFAKRAVKRPDGSYTRRAGTPDELVPVPNVAEPIVTREELAAVKDRLTTNKAHAHRNNRNPEATLLRAGFAICGHCGSVLAVANRGTSSRSPRYWCVERNKHVHDCPQPSIAANLIDGPVWERVCEVLRDPAIIAKEVNRYRTDGGFDRDLAAITKQFASVADKQGRTARAIAAVDDEDAAAPLLAELRALAARKKALEVERNTLTQRIADRATEDAKLQTLTDWCSLVGTNLDTLSYDEKRLALDALGVKVRVYRSGATDEAGEPLPRWEVTLRPVSPTVDVVYTPARHG